MRLVLRIPRYFLVPVLFMLCCGLGWAQSDEQSLADIAKKDKEQAAAAKKTTKVFTDDDVQHGSSASGAAEGSMTPSASDKQSQGASPAATAAAEAPAAGGDTAAKPQDAQDAKAKVQSLKTEEASSKDVVQHLEQLMANETDENRRQNYANALKHGQQHLSDVQQQLVDAEKAAASAPSSGGDTGQQSAPPPSDQAPQ